LTDIHALVGWPLRHAATVGAELADSPHDLHDCFGRIVVEVVFWRCRVTAAA
jgi:hypothetical protein